MTEHKLSLSRAFTGAKTQLNHVKRNLPRADSKNILTFSGKCWCCHCDAVAFISVLSRCPVPPPAGSGAWALLPVLPTRGEPATLPVLAGSSVLPTCLRDTAKLAFPRACPVRLFLSCLSLLLASQCAPKHLIRFFFLCLSGFIYYLLMTFRGHSSDRFCYDDCSKILRLY